MKKHIVLVASIISIALTGCTSLSSIRDSAIEKRSGIASDPDYQKYEDYKNGGLLNADGKVPENADISKYIDSNDNSTKISSTDQVHVTFGNNSKLQVTYYSNKERTDPINTNDCYLNEGDAVYADTPVVVNEQNNYYEFQKYEIREYQSKIGGISSVVDDVTTPAGLVFKATKDYLGKEISISPVGKYNKANTEFDSVFVAGNGQNRSVNTGTWTVNNVTDGTTIEDSKPNGSYSLQTDVTYIVNYNYLKDSYYFVNSYPESFSENDGNVQFPEVEAGEEGPDTYLVVLHQWLYAELSTEDGNIIDKFLKKDNSGVESVDVNGKSIKSLNGYKLKTGDKVGITTDDKHNVYCKSLPVEQPEKVKNGYHYTIEIPDDMATGTVEITVKKGDPVNESQYVVNLNTKDKYGSVSYTMDGKDISGIVYVRDGQTIKMKYEITDPSYVIDHDGFISPVINLIWQKKATVDIKVDAEIDGQTISRSNYINVKKK